MTDVIQAAGLVKRYGEVTALDGLDLTVPEGTVLGLLGPNGAGKTTAVRILTTLLRPDAGTATVAGFDVLADPRGVRERIGLSGQYAAVDEHLTGFENLDMIGRLYRLGRAGRASGPASCSSGSRSPTPATARSRPTPAACAAGSTSPARWSPRRRCCSSTSPRRGSTPAAALEMWDVIRELVAGARRCCSRRSTSRRPTTSPTRSSSSTTAGSSPRAPPTSSRRRSAASASRSSSQTPPSSRGARRCCRRSATGEVLVEDHVRAPDGAGQRRRQGPREALEPSRRRRHRGRSTSGSAARPSTTCS